MNSKIAVGPILVGEPGEKDLPPSEFEWKSDLFMFTPFNRYDVHAFELTFKHKGTDSKRNYRTPLPGLQIDVYHEHSSIHRVEGPQRELEFPAIADILVRPVRRVRFQSES